MEAGKLAWNPKDELRVAMLDLKEAVWKVQAAALHSDNIERFVASTKMPTQVAITTMLQAGIQCLDEVANSLANDGKGGREALAIVLRSAADTIGA